MKTLVLTVAMICFASIPAVAGEIPMVPGQSIEDESVATMPTSSDHTAFDSSDFTLSLTQVVLAILTGNT